MTKAEPVGFFAFSPKDPDTNSGGIWEELMGPDCPGATPLFSGDVVEKLERELAAIKGQEPVGILLNREGKVRWNQSIGLRIGAALYAQPVASVADKDAERYRFFITALSQNEAWAFDLVDLAHKADFDGTIDAAMAKGE